jgi:acetoacetyl-CoA synthetase
MSGPSRGPIWTPPPDRAARSNLAAFISYVRRRDPVAAREVRDTASLYRWSVDQREAFWPAVWRFCGVVADERAGADPWDTVGIGLHRMAPPDPVLGPRWFPGARLNFAENLLRHRDDRPAVIARDEAGRRRVLSHSALADEVTRAAASLAAHGIRPGDRVAAFMPNLPETVIAMLATASLGAIWSSCSPDFGVRGVLDRFGQIAPRILLAADGYRYADKEIDVRDRVREVAASIPTIERVVMVPHLRDEPALDGVPNATPWEDWLAAAPVRDLAFSRLPFDHPLYILYSSGTTGLPKCMVHGAGGTLLQHQKEHVLHVDLRPHDRVFYYTTCGWMMWNWLASVLAVGAAIVLYDGAPLAPDVGALWDLAEQEAVTVFGTSARYLALAEKAGVAPRETHDLAHLRTIISTGSPLAAHSHDYVYQRVHPAVHLCNISGGTELISCFALGDPTAPVRRGEMQTRGLGMAVDVFDAAGAPLRGAPGELVCTKPFPSMPVAFWNDPDGAKYRAAYFEHYPNAWRHGDWAELTPWGGVAIHGRSDATLNPGGVRIGTAEIYRQVEQLPEVVESLAIGRRGGDGGGDEQVVLFVRLRDGLRLDDGLRERIRRRLREHASPHHVPWRIVQVADIPRTISGKISELAVRAVVHGEPVSNTAALANPAALELFAGLPELADERA